MPERPAFQSIEDPCNLSAGAPAHDGNHRAHFSFCAQLKRAQVAGVLLAGVGFVAVDPGAARCHTARLLQPSDFRQRRRAMDHYTPDLCFAGMLSATAP